MKGKLAAALGGISLGLIAHSILEFGDNIRTLANNLDISTDSAQRFHRAMRTANIESSAFQKTLGTLDETMAKWKGGSLDEKKIGLMRQLGFSEKDFDLPPDELLTKALENTKDRPQSEVQSIFQQLGIKNKIAGQIVGNREDILSKDFPIVSEDLINKLDALGDAFSDLKEALIIGLIPSFVESAKMLAGLIRDTVNYFMAESRRDAKMEELAAREGGHKPAGWFTQMGAKEADWLQKGLLATGITTHGSTVDEFLTEKKNRALYGKDWRQYVDRAANAAAEKSDFELALDKLEENLTKKADKGAKKEKAPYTRTPIESNDKPNLQNARAPSLGQLPSADFMSIGGFMGADVQYRLSRLSEEANQYLERIATATEKLADANTNSYSDEEFQP